MNKLMVAVLVAAAFAAAANAVPRVVVAEVPASERNHTLVSNAAVRAGLDFEVRKGKRIDWESESAFAGADVFILTGGFNDYAFPTDAARREIVKFAASGKGVLLCGFRCGPVRTSRKPVFPAIGTTYGGHPLTPWIEGAGESPLAAAFGGKMLNFSYFDCLGLRLGPKGEPFAKCSGETVGAFGPCGRGRVALFGAFVGDNGELRDGEATETVLATVLKWLAGPTQPSDAEKSAAVAAELAALDRYDEILRLTLDDTGPGRIQGVIPEARDVALIPVESRQFRLEHYARTLGDAALAAECRGLAAPAKDIVAEIRKEADAAISAVHAGNFDKKAEVAATNRLAEIAKRCDIAAIDALVARCRAKAREERKEQVAAEHRDDIATLPSLVARLSSADGAERLEVATELGRIGEATPEVESALVKAVDDADDKVAVQAVASLAWMQARGAVDALIAKASGANCEDHVRRRAAQALGQIGDERAVPALMPLLASRDRWLRENAILSLGYLKAREAVPTLVKYAKGEGVPEHDGRYTRDESNTVFITRECAISALGDIGDASALPALDEIAADKKKIYACGFVFACKGMNLDRLAEDAAARIKSGGRPERGVRQPAALSSRRFFYALTKRNNLLVGRFYWTLPLHPSFKDADTHALMLPYLLDCGCTGFLDGWEKRWATGDDALLDLIRECDELGLVTVEQVPGAWPGSTAGGTHAYTDVLKGSQDYAFEKLADVPLYLGCWSEEGWSKVESTGRDLEAWLRRRHGDGYRDAMGLTQEQDPLAHEKWAVWNSEAGADLDKYAPGANSGALRVAAHEKGGEDIEERWRETQDWLFARRKGFSFTYNISECQPANVVGGQAAQERIGVFGPETYQACGRGNVFLMERARNGLARPVLAEFYNMYSQSKAHDLRGFYEDAIRSKCFYPFGLNQISPFFSAFSASAWAKHRWGELRRVYEHVRDNAELYAVSPSATEVAVVVSERSEAAFRCQDGIQTAHTAIDQRGGAVYAALSMSHIYADALHIDVADERRLAKYKVVFLTNAKILTRREQEILRNWVASGGTLVCDGTVSLFDDRNLALRGDYAIADLLGVKYKGTDFAPSSDVWQLGMEKGNKHPIRVRQGLDNPWRFNSHVYRDFKPSDCVVAATGGVEYDASLGIDRVELNGAKAVQTFEDGSPALTVNEYGKGRVYFFAANAPSLGFVASNYESGPNRLDFWPGVRETYEKIAREGLARAGTAQAVDLLNAPDELDLVIYSQKNGDRLVVHLLDRDESRASLDGVTLRINGNRKIKAVYRPGGKPLTPAGRTVSLGKFDVYDMIVVDFVR